MYGYISAVYELLNIFTKKLVYSISRLYSIKSIIFMRKVVAFSTGFHLYAFCKILWAETELFMHSEIKSHETDNAAFEHHGNKC